MYYAFDPRGVEKSNVDFSLRLPGTGEASGEGSGEGDRGDRGDRGSELFIEGEIGEESVG